MFYTTQKMNFRLFFTLILFISHGNCSKLFLLGGGTRDTNSLVYEALKSASGKLNPKISVVISAAPSLADGILAYYDDSDPDSISYQTLFKNYGFQPTFIELAKDNYQIANTWETDLGTRNIMKIQQSDIVFFNGGDQSRHSRSWLNDDGSDSDIMTELRKKFQDGTVVIAGTSAGLAVQSELTFGEGRSYGYLKFNDLKNCAIGEELSDDREGTNSERYDINGAYMKGFGFVQGLAVDSHFDARGRFGRMTVAMNQTGSYLGFGVDEDTGVLIDLNSNLAQVFGRYGIWVMDSSEVIFGSEFGLYFEASGYKISYLSHNDVYHLDSKTVTTEKKLIEIPYYEEGYDSKDIFALDEALSMITRLVDSEYEGSVGTSKENNPKFSVWFYKNYTRGYYDENSRLYTIDNLNMDIYLN